MTNGFKLDLDTAGAYVVEGIPDPAYSLKARDAKGISTRDNSDNFVVTSQQPFPDVAYALTAEHGGRASGRPGTTNLVAFSHTQGLDPQVSDEAWPTLRAGGGGMAVAELPADPDLDAKSVYENQRGEIYLSEQTNSLTTGGGKPGQGYPMVLFEPKSLKDENWAETEVKAPLRAEASTVSHVLVDDPVVPPPPTGIGVRRLTPRECERLQGWPDDHTRYDANGTELPDTFRYRSCGNGVTAPVAAWVATHLLAAMPKQSEI